MHIEPATVQTKGVLAVVDSINYQDLYREAFWMLEYALEKLGEDAIDSDPNLKAAQKFVDIVAGDPKRKHVWNDWWYEYVKENSP